MKKIFISAIATITFSAAICQSKAYVQQPVLDPPISTGTIKNISYKRPQTTQDIVDVVLRDTAWIKVDSSAHGEQYISKNIITKYKDKGDVIVRGWARSEHVNNLPSFKEVGNASSLMIMDFNCRTGKYAVCQVYPMDSHHKILPDMAQFKPIGFQVAESNTTGEVFLVWSCIYYNGEMIDSISSKTSLERIPTFDEVMGNSLRVEPHWNYSVKSDHGDKWYLWSEYEGIENGTIKIWAKASLNNLQIGSKVYKNAEEKSLLIFDVRRKMFKQEYVEYYNSKGESIFVDESIGWSLLIPETIYYTMNKQLKAIYGLN